MPGFKRVICGRSDWREYAAPSIGSPTERCKDCYDVLSVGGGVGLRGLCHSIPSGNPPATRTLAVSFCVVVLVAQLCFVAPQVESGTFHKLEHSISDDFIVAYLLCQWWSVLCRFRVFSCDTGAAICARMEIGSGREHSTEQPTLNTRTRHSTDHQRHSRQATYSRSIPAKHTAQTTNGTADKQPAPASRGVWCGALGCAHKCLVGCVCVVAVDVVCLGGWVGGWHAYWDCVLVFFVSCTLRPGTAFLTICRHPAV
jgi:hypothetical protein